MNDYIEKQKVEFDSFVDKWEKALEQGIFKSPELPQVNPQTSTGSFFGLHNTHPTDQIAQTDNEYWKAIYQASGDHMPENPEVFTEAEHRDIYPSNPQARDTLGSDQEMQPQQLGITYSNEELEQLAELKKQLYGLEVKLLTSMGFGDDKNQKKIESQIESLKKEINKLSDEAGIAYKNDTPKHLKNY